MSREASSRAVYNEHPSSIAERFIDGFMHPGLEHDAERLARGYRNLEEQFERVLYIAENLFQMVPQGVWRKHGAEWQGQYEGDYHAEQLRGELASYRASIPASEPKA